MIFHIISLIKCLFKISPKMIIFTSLIIVMFSCDEAKYDLNNPNDPENIDLVPPALFFHPPVITASLGESISVELYGYKLNPAAAAHLEILYDWGSVQVDSVVPGLFFTGENDPVEIFMDADGILDVFLYYLPDTDADQNEGGTRSLAKIYFTTLSTGESELVYGSNTKLRKANNDSVTVNELGTGLIHVE